MRFMMLVSSLETPNVELDCYSTDQSGTVKYTFDKYGFRSNHKKGKFKLLAIGCSHTFGTGINFENTYPYVLGSLITDDFEIINLSAPSVSNDYINRMLVSNFDSINPDLTVIYFTYPNRREHITEDGKFIKIHLGQECLDDSIKKAYYSIDNNYMSMRNMTKNVFLCDWFLKNRKAKYLMGSVKENLFDFFVPFNLKVDKKAADGEHAGVKSNYKFACNLYRYFV